MSYVLTTSQFNSGLQQNSCKLLQSLRHITEVSPFIIADVRIQLETGQIQPFTDDAFRDFLTVAVIRLLWCRRSDIAEHDTSIQRPCRFIDI